MNARFRGLMFLGAAVAGLLTSLVWAEQNPPRGDWPCWRGPERSGLSKETGLLKAWPKEGPKLVWKATGLGDGYSTPSIAGGRIYVMGTKGGQQEFVFCLDDSGKQLWSAEAGRMSRSYPGPRSTPTIAAGRVYAIGSNGLLVCLSADKGEVLWKKNLESEFSGRKGMWGYAESPLVDGDVVLVTPGGGKATLVALACKDGKEVWRSSVTGLKAPAGRGGRGGFGRGGQKQYNEAGYSSALVAEVGGVKQYIQYLAGGVVGISAKDGKLLWHYDEIGGGNAVAATPLYRDGAVFAATSYGVGAGRADIKKREDGTFKAEPKFAVEDFQNHHGGMVLVGDYVYGADRNALRCVSFKDGSVAWRQVRNLGKGSITYADGHLYFRGEGGTLVLVEATPTGYKEKGRFKQPDRSDQKAWAHPVVAGGKLYLRDWDALFCYDIKAK
jgi:outer membrane protein assembly factor BamB